MPLLWGAFSLGLATWLAYRGHLRGSLSFSGACAATFVGTVCMASGKLYGLILLLFYFAGSAATRHKAAAKAQFDGDLHKAARSAAQVLGTAGVGVCLLLARRLSGSAPCELRDSSLHAYLGSFACVLGDTLASELGVLSRAPPRLLTTCARVPRGTNGGCSPEGLAYSAAGGLLVGAAAAAYLGALGGSAACGSAAAAPPAHLLRLAAAGAAAGLAGSLLDSLLGATLQASYYRDGRALLQAPEGEAPVPPPAGLPFEQWPRAGAAAGSLQVYWVSGLNVLSNEGVNFCSSAGAGALMAWLMAQGLEVE